MNKIFNFIKGVFRGFFANPFWKDPSVLVSLGLSLAINGILWYIFESKVKQNPIIFIFASVLIVLNFGLANFLWNREKLASSFLGFTCLFIQVLTLFFVRYLFLTF